MLMLPITIYINLSTSHNIYIYCIFFVNKIFVVEVCERPKLVVNAAKNKVIIVEWEGESNCTARIEAETLEVVSEFVDLTGDK